jgi:hypothetical protein
MAVLPTGIGPVTGYNIERSLRFNSADSAYLNRTAGTPTNQIKWTFSGWIKRSTFGAYSTILSGGSTVNDYSWYGFDNNDKFSILHVVGGVNLGDNNSTSTMVFRDPSAWYHVVIVYDSANATAANRTILYVNGVQQTISAFPALNTSSSVNASGITQYIAQRGYSAIYNNGYMTEMNFIDGQALTPSDFGETDAATGVWKPKAYSGTYGTNGFELNFSDNSNTTAATLGKDSSGNGNNWTPNNFSVTAGAGNDSLVDSPTAYGTDTGVGGEVRGNYATWNGASIGADATLSNGNLDISYGSSGTINATMGTFGMSSGKWYWEVTITASSTSPARSIIGITNNPSSSAVANYPGFAANGWGYDASSGNKFNNGSSSSYGATYTTNDVIGFAFDADAGSITAYKNGSSQGTMFSSLTAGTYFPAIGDGSGGNTFTASANFGQRAFAYTAPSGFKALVTTNLPTPTIGATSTTQAGKYFDIVLYQAATTNGTFTRGNLSFRPDFTWIKNRDNVERHFLIDAVRGNTSVTDKFLVSNSTAAEGANSVDGTTFSVTDTGYEFVESSINSGELFFNNRTYVGWNWKANGAGSSNTAGTITSTVSANTTSGFSIVTYTGNGTNSGTVSIGHGLGVKPSMIIVKDRDTSSTNNNWFVTHVSSPTNYLFLNNTDAAASASSTTNGAIAQTNATSTTIVLSNGTTTANNLNENGDKYVAYCFAPVAGYSAFGSYTGNGSTDGPFVYTGFRPRFVMIKRTDSAGNNWTILDSVRSESNDVDDYLYPNLSIAEIANTTADVDFLSNGFKIRNTTSDQNTSGGTGTYIYAAFAETPAKFSLAR